MSISPTEAYEIEQFLYLEAELLDARKYNEWLELVTDDCIYWMPNGREEIDPEKEASLIYDDLNLLKLRIARMNHPMVHAQTPPSRLAHVVGNIRIQPEGDSVVKVRSNFTMLESRLGEQRTFGGSFEHTLRRENGSWRIAFKRIDLVNNDGVFRNLVFLF